MSSSVRIRITLFFVTGVLLVLGGAIGFVIAEVGKQYTELFRQHGEVAASQLAERAEKLLGLGLLLHEFLGFEQQCSEIVSTHAGVGQAFLVDAQGRVLYRSGHAGTDPALLGPDLEVADRDAEFILIRRPLQGLGAGQGSVVIAVDSRAIDAEVYALLRKIGILGFVLIVGGTILLMGFLQFSFGRPARTLLQHINAIDPERLQHLPPDLPSRRDELGAIAEAFDGLVRRLSLTQKALLQANEALAHHRQVLEEAVEARTSELRHANAELERLALTDALTGLPNRRLFMELLHQRHASARRHDHSLAVFMIDLDGFKQINDRYGHDAGDYTLRVIAERIRVSCRSADTFARLGGDEFVLLIDDYRTDDDLAAVAAKLHAVIREPFVRDGRRLVVGGSIGVATMSGHLSEDADSLLKAADRAMYRAKAQGGGHRFDST